MKKNIYKNESLSKYNWFNLGGPAETFFKPNNEIEIKDYLSKMNSNGDFDDFLCFGIAL